MAMDEFRIGAPQIPSDMHPTRSGSKASLLIITIVVVLVGALWLTTKSGLFSGGSKTIEIAPGQTLTTVSKGSVVPTFPKELLLEPEVVAQESYSITYADEGLAQPVVSYRSLKTLEENIAMFNVFLTSNNWTITHRADISEIPATYYYAYKDGAEVNITFATDQVGVTVIIAYVFHQQPTTTQ